MLCCRCSPLFALIVLQHQQQQFVDLAIGIVFFFGVAAVALFAIVMNGLLRYYLAIAWFPGGHTILRIIVIKTAKHSIKLLVHRLSALHRCVIQPKEINTNSIDLTEMMLKQKRKKKQTTSRYAWTEFKVGTKKTRLITAASTAIAVAHANDNVLLFVGFFHFRTRFSAHIKLI